ncbi:unnamed protein product [Effrenium voratum]|nr:unnamed protein product [Effrenium voratum]
MPDEGEPPVEWVFEVEDGQAEEVLHPPPSGPSNSWLGWLQGASPPRHRGALSRESDTSAATLPGEECLSRDPDALPPEDAEDRGSIFSKMGFPGWFANEPDNPLPPPMPSRMDEHDARSVKRSSQGNVKWSVELDIPDDMLEDEVTHERMARTQSQHTNMPTAENMVSSSALPEDYVRKDTYSDAFLEQFGPSEMAAAVAAATACPDIVPEPEPPLPPPSIPPEEEGFHEVPRGHSPPPASPRDGSHPTTPREPREEKMAAAAPGSPWSPAHISVQNYPMQEKPEEKSEGDKAPWIQDVAVVVDHSESKSDEEPERPTGCCARCKACCCTRRRRKDPEDEKVRQTRSKLLEEEIEDFSGTPMMGCVAWLSHRGLARFPTFCVAFGAIFVMATIGIGMVVRPVEVEVDWDSFLKTDVNTSTMRDVFLFALQHRQTDRRLSAHTELSGRELGRELAEGRELQGETASTSTTTSTSRTRSLTVWLQEVSAS